MRNLTEWVRGSMGARGASRRWLWVALGVSTATPVLSSEMPRAPLEAVDRASVRLLLASQQEAASLMIYATMATWCGSCKKELPQFELLRHRFDADEVGLYAVPVDPADTKEKLDRYVATHRPDYELIRDAQESQILLTRRIIFGGLGFDRLPATVVTDSSGRVLHVQAGVPTVSKVRQLLAGLTGGR